MGNSNPHKLKDQQTADLVRKRFFSRIEKELNGSLICGDIPAVGLFSKDDYYVAVSHGCSSKVGTEFVLKFYAATKEIARELTMDINPIFHMFITMQDNSKFGPYETAEVITPLKWEKEVSGTQGCAILLDTTLKGLNSNGDDSFNEDGPLHDDDYWPQHFLLVFPLRPVEYRFTTAVNPSNCLPVIQTINPNFITDFSRSDFLLHPIIGPQLHELQLSSAAKTFMDGLTFDLRIRKNGTCVDLVMGPRWMAPLLEGLEQAFNKPIVPVGTCVVAEADGYACQVSFSCHDIYKNNELITPETAYYKIIPIQYMNGKTDELVDLSTDLKRKYCLLSPGELWQQHGLIRMVHAEFFFPSLLLKDMIHRVRAAVLPQMDNGTWDPDERPVILEWEDQFVGLNGRSGFMSPEEQEDQEQEEEHGTATTSPNSPPPPPPSASASSASPSASVPQARFRFICAGISYREDELYLDDEGVFHRREEEEGEEDGEEWEDVEEEDENENENEA